MCNADISAFYDLSAEVVRLNAQIMNQAAWAPGKQMVPGRVVLLRDGHYPGNVAVVLRNAPSIMTEGVKRDSRAFWVLALVTKGQKSKEDDIKDSEVSPRWPAPLPARLTNPQWELKAVDSSSVSFVTTRILKADTVAILDKRSKEVSLKTMNELVRLQEQFASGDVLDEFDWSRLSKLEFQELLRQRIALSDRISKLGCTLCKDFEDHVSLPLAETADGSTRSFTSANWSRTLFAHCRWRSRTRTSSFCPTTKAACKY